MSNKREFTPEEMKVWYQAARAFFQPLREQILEELTTNPKYKEKEEVHRPQDAP